MKYIGTGKAYLADDYSVLHICDSNNGGLQREILLKCPTQVYPVHEQKQRLEKIQNASLGSWYDVTYIKNHMDFQCPVREYQDACRRVRLRLDNMNGWGIGTVFFVTEDDKLMVLHWRAIVAMIPV